MKSDKLIRPTDYSADGYGDVETESVYQTSEASCIEAGVKKKKRAAAAYRREPKAKTKTLVKIKIGLLCDSY